jgi:hypothetical protein
MARIKNAAELAAPKGTRNSLSSKELGLLAMRLAAASSRLQARRIKERLSRGFYGI